MSALLIKGLITGFAIAAPIGPIGTLCIQRSLANGFNFGLFTGFGAASANGVYGLIAAFGFTAISSIMLSYQFWIHLLGGLFLLYLGGKLLFTPPAEQAKSGQSTLTLGRAYFSMFLLTITNPMSLVTFMAIFAGLGLGNEHVNYLNATLLVLTVIIGSASWWGLLSGGVAFILRRRANPRVMRIINYISGITILSFGVAALLT